MTSRPSPPARRSWGRTRVSVAAAYVGGALLLIGAVTGRPDVAVLGAAPIVSATWAWARRPVGSVLVDAGEAGPEVPSGTLETSLWIDGPPGTVAALVSLRRRAREVSEVLVATPTGHRSLPLRVVTVRTGPQEVATLDAQGLGGGLGSISAPSEPRTRAALVLPTTRPLDDLPLPPRLRGLTGSHDSRRPGEGGSLRDVHPFAPGDRLRRIDWRVTAKRAPDLHELYVRREHALAEAVVMLIVDSRDDVGPDPRTWRGSLQPRAQDATSLDLARQAATSVAQAYLSMGDRVGLDDLGARRRALTPGGGRRQLDRVRHALALTKPEGEPLARVRPPQLPSGALVMVFSTFLDDGAAQAAVQWRRSGHRVVAVDALPTLRTRGFDDRERLALRLVRIAREDRLAGLQDHDVELVHWRDAPAVALAGLARRGRRRPGAAS
ncbi:DUF58 domain-containing protein [Cellulomonas alba]|uniref:DUF58 domain-containing protein n=1 Tax=Cellulomonas alba TaxID=3053467 RepID=A0ABT7SFE8_9CELL|nr:DUF58 domain-containing protein [Cellulomonas alba]MDM7854919.1 DUF58 domain-containing protein [Cellulomonas alba]